MDMQRLLDRYLSAWNQRDMEGLLQLMHGGASLHDAFWRETCVGRDLRQYLHDSFEEELYWYRQDGDLIITDSGLVYRYNAYFLADHEGRTAVYNGAEVLVLQDDKIVTTSNFYCEPNEIALIEVARLAEKRHGESNYAKSGLGAFKCMRFRNRLSAAMNLDHVYLDPSLSASRLANRIGCSIDHLRQVIDIEHGTGFAKYVNEFRARHAKDLLGGDRANCGTIDRVAQQSGFTSVNHFNEEFHKLFGETPEEYRRRGAD